MVKTYSEQWAKEMLRLLRDQANDLDKVRRERDYYAAQVGYCQRCEMYGPRQTAKG